MLEWIMNGVNMNSANMSITSIMKNSGIFNDDFVMNSNFRENTKRNNDSCEYYWDEQWLLCMVPRA